MNLTGDIELSSLCSPWRVLISEGHAYWAAGFLPPKASCLEEAETTCIINSHFLVSKSLLGDHFEKGYT